jgi:hypothetical protein
LSRPSSQPDLKELDQSDAAQIPHRFQPGSDPTDCSARPGPQTPSHPVVKDQSAEPRLLQATARHVGRGILGGPPPSVNAPRSFFPPRQAKVRAALSLPDGQDVPQ